MTHFSKPRSNTIYFKQALADITTTSVFETTQRFARFKTPSVIKCLNQLIYK